MRLTDPTAIKARSDVMFLSPADLAECRRAAKEIFVADLSRTIRCGGYRIQLEGSDAESIGEIDGGLRDFDSPRGQWITVKGIGPINRSFDPRLDKGCLAATPEAASILERDLVGAIAYGLAFCRARNADIFRQDKWDEMAALAQRVAFSTRLTGGASPNLQGWQAAWSAVYRDRSDYFLNPYEAHARTTQIVSVVILDALSSGGSKALKTMSNYWRIFEQRVREASVAVRIRELCGPQGDAVVDELWRRAGTILHRMAADIA